MNSYKVRDVHLAWHGTAHTAQHGWNKKLCFEARDTLYACADGQENGNKYRCPDELYAYEMWCPNDFRRIHSHRKRQSDIHNEMYDKAHVDQINSDRAYISSGHFITK